ncbi:MAG: CHASE2 domain-containing protein [Alphaproteobacteria bacterium]|nr:CHASE2 domain-containing protein [Alphaproteobacteria bacterium]
MRTWSFDRYHAVIDRDDAPGPVTVVDIDDASLGAVGQWPWPRDRMAALVDALTRAGTQVIGFDVLFADPDRLSPHRLADCVPDAAAADALRRLPDNDEVFARSIMASRVVLGHGSRAPATGRGADDRPPQSRIAVLSPDQTLYTPGIVTGLSDIPTLVRNVDVIEQAAVGAGVFTTFLDSDGVVRRVPAVVRVGETLQLGFAVEVVRVSLGARGLLLHVDGNGTPVGLTIQGRTIPVDPDGRIWVPFGRSVETVPAHRVLDGSVDPARLAGRIVLIGSSAAALADLYLGPRRIAAPGVKLHAELIEGILGDRLLSRTAAATVVELAMALLGGILLIALAPGRRLRVQILLLAVILTLIAAVAGAALLGQRAILDATFPALSVIAVTCLLGLAGYRQEERLRLLHQRQIGRRDALMHGIVEASFDTILSVDARGRIATANAAASTLFDRPAASLIGTALVDHLEPDPPDMPPLDTVAPLVAISRSGSPGERLLLRTGRSAIPVDIAVTEMVDHGETMFVVVLHDLTARRVAEDLAQRARQRLEDAIERVEDAFALYDRDRRLVLCNSAYRRLFGSAHEEIGAGTAYAECLRAMIAARNAPGSALEEPEAWIVRQIAEFDNPPPPMDRLNEDGRWWSVRAQRTREEGLVSFLVNIDAAKRREAELDASQRRAELASTAKSAFLANVSHELRTPLNAIIGFSELIRRRTFGAIENPRYADYVDNIHESARFLLQLIDDLLDVAQVETGSVKIEDALFDVGVLVASAFRMVQTLAADRGVTLVPEIPPETPGLRGDPRLVRQALLNLLNNAIESTPSGGWIVTRTALDRRGAMRISIEDTGAGIAAETLAVLAEPFQRGDHPMIRNRSGTGLGLAIVKAFMQAHDGTLELESSLGHGTVATLVFPRARVVARPRAAVTG